jgi:pimeloyl-ACP methyl ester carboxylesterase
VTLDPRRLRIRRADGPISFDVTASVRERGGASDETSLRATIGVPLLVLPGFGTADGPSTADALPAALDAAAGGAWGTGGTRPLAVVHRYDAVADTLPQIARGLDAQARTLLRGTPFRRVDVVGYSMGGLVAREWIAGAGKGRVRNLVLLGTPNEGIPTVALLLFASRTGLLDSLLAGAAGGIDLGGLGIADLLDPQTEDALGLFVPTYDWAFVDLGFGGPVSASFLLNLGEPPLDTLNATAPDPGLAAVHSFVYTAVLPGGTGLPAGTLDEVDLTPLLAAGGGGGLDLSDPDLLLGLFSGEGDGLVPARSAWMDGVPAWSGSPRFEKHDLGAGTHLTYAADPRVIAAVAGVLTK